MGDHRVATCGSGAMSQKNSYLHYNLSSWRACVVYTNITKSRQGRVCSAHVDICVCIWRHSCGYIVAWISLTPTWDTTLVATTLVCMTLWLLNVTCISQVGVNDIHATMWPQLWRQIQKQMSTLLQCALHTLPYVLLVREIAIIMCALLIPLWCTQCYQLCKLMLSVSVEGTIR